MLTMMASQRGTPVFSNRSEMGSNRNVNNSAVANGISNSRPTLNKKRINASNNNLTVSLKYKGWVSIIKEQGFL